MAHGIMEHDKGFVHGTTWHGLENYKQLDRPVMYSEAVEVMDYPIEKRELFRKNADGLMVPADGAYEIVRSDMDFVLAPMVGNQFICESNLELLEFVKVAFLDNFKEIEIESVGTLFGGSTCFLNLKLAEHHVKGDESPTMSNLMYYNPIGKGSYKTCAHTTRIVCANTLRIAELEGGRNGTMLKVRHTGGAKERISDHLVDIAQIHMGLEKHQEKMEFLTGIEMNAERAEAYFKALFPIDEKKASEAMVTRRENKILEINQIFNSDQSLKGATRTSAYAMLQATTDFVDHTAPRANADSMSVSWNGLVGQGSEFKDLALKALLNVA